MVRYGISVPNFGEFGDARRLAHLAREAEDAGWDGFFIWDHVQFQTGYAAPFCDPWVALTAIALATERVRIGPLVTPLARRRPSQLARETVSVDQISNGRLILGVGLGAPADSEFEQFGEDGNAQVRAQKLDEALDIVTGLWSGEPFSYAGEHFQVHEAVFQPTPAQQPRIPIWVAGLWPNKRPMRRAARWDGVNPESRNSTMNAMPVEEVREVVTYIRTLRAEQASEPFDVVVAGQTTGTNPTADAELVGSYVDAGLTWWIENLPGHEFAYADIRERILLGPPAV
jgi:alkanesulfonate monooxygenase SsuD/methylene tetrahydromethanopterin reductase-like flavin-dependent oxidoreductase (luciferase family)